MNDEQKELIADFIKGQNYATVATTWNGEPQAATVAFSERNETEIIFGTLKETRKYRNLKSDPKIAIVIGWDQSVTVQIEGIAHETMGELQEECMRIHVIKNPGSARYMEMEGQCYFKVTPRWIRYTDISVEPEFVFEVSLA